MPYLEEKQDSKMPQELLWLLDLGTAAPGRALSRFHLKHLAQPMEMLWQRICPGALSHPEEHLSLLLPPPGSFGAGHEDEICFNPKVSPSEERERVSSSFIPQLEVRMSPSHGEIQSRGGTDLPALLKGTSPLLAQVRWLCPSSWADNKTISRTKIIPAVFTPTFGVTTGNIFASGDTKVQSSGHWGF